MLDELRGQPLAVYPDLGYEPEVFPAPDVPSLDL